MKNSEVEKEIKKMIKTERAIASVGWNKGKKVDSFIDALEKFMLKALEEKEK